MQDRVKILIVDDDDVDRMAARRALIKAGFQAEITEATTGAKALAALKHESYDCALLDYHLPDGDGLDMLQRIREMGIATPIIVLTGRGDEEIAVETMKAGAADYISKNRLSASSLARSVRAAVRLHRAERQKEQAEQAHTESEQRFHVMADSAPVLIWMTDPEGGLTYVNKGWLDFTGRTMDEERGQGWTAGAFPADLTQVIAITDAARNARKPYKVEYRLRRADGQYRWMLGSGVPRVVPEEGFAGYIGSCVDITERKEVEEALVRNQAHIAALNKDLRNTMSTMHDRVRNSLQILTAMVDLMTMHGGDMVSAADVRQLGTHIHIMAAVQDLLMQQARTDGKANLISVRAVIDRLTPLFDRLSKGCRFEVDIEDVRLPAQQAIALPIVVNELLTNAFQYGCQAGRSITLTLRKDKDSAVVTVTDEGRGFPPDFDPSISAHTGLELVERLSRWDLLGKTHYDNVPGGGARVTLTIPLPLDKTCSS